MGTREMARQKAELRRRQRIGRRCEKAIEGERQRGKLRGGEGRGVACVARRVARYRLVSVYVTRKKLVRIGATASMPP